MAGAATPEIMPAERQRTNADKASAGLSDPRENVVPRYRCGPRNQESSIQEIGSNQREEQAPPTRSGH